MLRTASLPPGPEVDGLVKSGVHHYMVVARVAHRPRKGGRTLNKPTHFEVRDGAY